MAKDVRLCLGEAERSDVPMLLGGTVDQLWALAARQAEDGDDCTAIVRMFEDWAGATIGGSRAMTDLRRRGGPLRRARDDAGRRSTTAGRATASPTAR